MILSQQSEVGCFSYIFAIVRLNIEVFGLEVLEKYGT